MEICYHCYHFIGVRGVGNNKGEKQLLIINGEGEFDQGILVFSKNFRTEYEQLFKAYNEGHYAMILIKNVTTTTKKDQYLKAKHYTILAKVINKVTCLMKLYNKLSSAQSTFKEINSFPFLCIIYLFLKFTHKTSNRNQCSSHDQLY